MHVHAMHSRKKGIIKVIDNDEIAFGLSKPKAPVLISGEGYKYIVLPVNIPA